MRYGALSKECPKTDTEVVYVLVTALAVLLGFYLFLVGFMVYVLFKFK